MKIEKIVLTGGPCAGKTTVVDYLRKNFGEYLVFVPEAATLLLESGYPPPNPWTEEWQKNFQHAIVQKQLELEAEAESEARAKNRPTIILDRGLLDTAAYLPGGTREFEEMFDISVQDALLRYKSVLHLESLSTLNPVKYEELKTSNPNRFEDVSEAAQRELALRSVWSGHPQRAHIDRDIATACCLVEEAIFSHQYHEGVL